MAGPKSIAGSKGESGPMPELLHRFRAELGGDTNAADADAVELR